MIKHTLRQSVCKIFRSCCTNKDSVEEARKFMVEGTVKIDGPVEVRGTLTLEKMVQNGETFLKLEKYDDALRVFTEITEKYPEDYRGWWGKAYLDLHRKNNCEKIIKILLDKEGYNSLAGLQ